MLTKEQSEKLYERLEVSVQELHMVTMDIKKSMEAGESAEALSDYLEHLYVGINKYSQLLSLCAFNKILEEGEDPFA